MTTTTKSFLPRVALAAVMFAATVAVPATASAEEFVLRIATQAPTGTPWSKLLQRLRNRVHNDTGGRVKVKIYYNGKLGSENKVVRRCQKGQIGGIAVSNGALGNAVPELFLTEAPYIFDSPQDADRRLDAATELVRELMDAKGFKFYMWGLNGMRHFASKEKFLASPADLAGQKMRAQPAKPHVLMYKALGASASTIAVGEVTTSLNSGVVTGYDNTLLYAYAAQWYKEVKYVTLTGHIYQAAIVAYCKPWFDKLPKDLQDILMKVPDGETALGRKLVRTMNKLLIKKYEAEGVKVKTPSAAEIAALRKATAGVIKTLEGETSDKGKKLLSILRK